MQSQPSQPAATRRSNMGRRGAIPVPITDGTSAPKDAVSATCTLTTRSIT